MLYLILVTNHYQTLDSSLIGTVSYICSGHILTVTKNLNFLSACLLSNGWLHTIVSYASIFFCKIPKQVSIPYTPHLQFSNFWVSLGAPLNHTILAQASFGSPRKSINSAFLLCTIEGLHVESSNFF